MPEIPDQVRNDGKEMLNQVQHDGEIAGRARDDEILNQVQDDE